METNTYKITVQGVAGSAYAMYKDSILRMLINELEGIPFLLSAINLSEAAFLEQSGIKIQKLQAKSVADKVAMFCMLYKQHKNVSYYATKEEKANLKNVTVNEQLLTAYLTTNTYPLTGAKSMADYVRHYNTVRDLVTNGRPVKSRFPDVYDSGYEKTIEGETLSAYWQHLIKLGWRKKDGAWQMSR